MLIDSYKKMPYDSETEIVSEDSIEDEDLPDQFDGQMQSHYYNMPIKDIVPNQKSSKPSKS
jgi:hypothetical protein